MRIFLFLLLLPLLWSCDRTEQLVPQESTQQFHPILDEVLQAPRPFVDGITFPAGTHITPSGVSSEAFTYELPPGYRTAWYTADQGQVSFGDRFGGYSCTCSGKSGSCKTFYTDQTGYGCLQNNCSGSCTGKPDDNAEARSSSAQFIGFVAAPRELSIGQPAEPASLSQFGRQVLLESDALWKVVSENYEFAYNALVTPEFENIAHGEIPEGHSLLQANVFGLAFGMLLPGSVEDLSELFPISSLIEGHQRKGADYSCTGANGCECKGDKKCRFGYCIYTCEGCTTCNLTVEK